MEVSQLNIRASYPITYTKQVMWFFNMTKSIEIQTSLSEFIPYKDAHAKSNLNILGVQAHAVLGYNHLTMREMYHTGLIHLFFYVVDDGQEIFRVLEIKDIVIEAKFRSLGIGSKLIRLMEEICWQNSVKCIFGTLEAKGGLEARKDFFMRNGFQLKQSPSFGFSNICAIKFINAYEMEKPELCY